MDACSLLYESFGSKSLARTLSAGIALSYNVYSVILPAIILQRLPLTPTRCRVPKS